MTNEIKQRSTAWFEQRKGRITGSVVGAILGVNPWQKPADVMRAMVREHHGYESEFNADIPPIHHGNNNEQRALLCFMRESGLNVEECGFFPYGDKLGASPDGLTSDGGILELKVPYGLRNGGEFKALEEQQHYYHQAQMEMLSTGRKIGYFAQYIAPKGDPFDLNYVPEQMNIERVEFDEQWLDKHLPAINEFYRQYLLEIGNPAHLEPLRASIDTPDAAVLLADIDALRARQKDDAAKEKELMGELIEMAGGKNAEVHGRKLTLVERVGSVSYAKAIAELLPDADLEKWRGKASSSWRLS